MTLAMSSDSGGGAPPPPARKAAAARWAARVLAAAAGAVLGMAVGHQLAWQAADPLPNDGRAHQIAAEFVPDLPGGLAREGAGWTAEPAGWRGALFGYTEHRDGQIAVHFPPLDTSPAERFARAELLADRLDTAGWQRVRLDPSYPTLTAYRDGLVVSFGPVLDDPSPPPADASQTAAEQEVLGMVVEIRRDTPAAAALGLAAGASVGALLAFAALVAGQRQLQGRPVARRRARALFAAGLVALAPATLATLGLAYLNLVDDLPHEPLWIAYSLPVTRPLALIGAGLLAGAAVVTMRSRSQH